MTDGLRVFNLSNAPYAFFGSEPEMYQIPARQWRVIPKNTALKLADNPDMFVDFGAGSFSDDMLPFLRARVKTLHFAGVLDSITGYGNATWPIVMDLLSRPDIDLSVGKTGFWHREYLPDTIKRIMDQVEQEPAKDFTSGDWNFRNPMPWPVESKPLLSRWGIALTIPPELAKVQTARKLLYTMCEGDTIPNGTGDGRDWQSDTNAWPQFIENYADVLVVPSEEMKSVFQKSVDKEVQVVPLGTSFDVFRFKPRTADRPPLFSDASNPRREHRDVFTIVVDGHLAPRKAPTLSLLEVVYPVLDKYEDWRMVIKCRAGEKGMLSSFKDDRIMVVAGDFSPSQMNDLYHAADVGLCLSLYEGWGMTFREMMATGLPVIVSQTSGHKEDCDPAFNYVVPVAEKEQIHDYFNIVAHRDIPDWSVAQAALETEYHNWKERNGVQSAMGERAAKWIRERRPWSKTTDMLLALVDDADEWERRKRGKW